jgi:hypothetical protein
MAAQQIAITCNIFTILTGNLGKRKTLNTIASAISKQRINNTIVVCVIFIIRINIPSNHNITVSLHYMLSANKCPL